MAHSSALKYGASELKAPEEKPRGASSFSCALSKPAQFVVFDWLYLFCAIVRATD